MKLRGLRYYQIGTPNYIYQNDKHKKVHILGDFERETPTYKGGAHAISKFWGKIKNS